MEILRIERGGDIGECRAIRRRVFIEEQAVTEEEEWDGLDGLCVHFLAVDGGRPVGTARLLCTQAGEARAQRVAVLREFRGRSVGMRLMEALEDEARSSGYSEMVLEGQVQAIPFYEKVGYVAEGGVFLDARIPHRLMRKRLGPHEV